MSVGGRAMGNDDIGPRAEIPAVQTPRSDGVPSVRPRPFDAVIAVVAAERRGRPESLRRNSVARTEEFVFESRRSGRRQLQLGVVGGRRDDAVSRSPADVRVDVRAACHVCDLPGAPVQWPVASELDGDRRRGTEQAGQRCQVAGAEPKVRSWIPNTAIRLDTASGRSAVLSGEIGVAAPVTEIGSARGVSASRSMLGGGRQRRNGAPARDDSVAP